MSRLRPIEPRSGAGWAWIRTLPTGLVLFGGEGSSVMLDIAKRVTAPAQFIFICGKNQKLAERLRGLKTRFRKHVEGFTSEIPYFMHLSDFFVGKPGPGSISEALHMKLPVVVERNAWTLPQERYNTDWIREMQVGVVLKSFREIDRRPRGIVRSGELRPLSRQRGRHQEPRGIRDS